MDILDTLCVSDEQVSLPNGTLVAESNGNISTVDSGRALAGLCETVHSEKVENSTLEHHAKEQIIKQSLSHQSDKIECEDYSNKDKDLQNTKIKEKHLPKVDLTNAGEEAEVDLNNCSSKVPASGLSEKRQTRVGEMTDRENEYMDVVSQILSVENTCNSNGKNCSSLFGENRDIKFSPVGNKSKEQIPLVREKQLLAEEMFDVKKNDLLSLIDREDSTKYESAIERKCRRKEDMSKYNGDPMCESTLHSELSNLEHASEIQPVENVTDTFALQEEDVNSTGEKAVSHLEKVRLKCSEGPIKCSTQFSLLQDEDKFSGEKEVDCVKEKHHNELECSVSNIVSQNLQPSHVTLQSGMEHGSKETELSVISCGVKTKEIIDCLSNKENNIIVLNKKDPYMISSSEDESTQERYRPLKRRLGTLKDQCYADGVFFESLNEFHGTEKRFTQADVPDNKRKRPSGRVMYIYSDELLEKTNGLNRIEGRAELIHCLIQTYGLLPFLGVKSPRPATEEEILGFHSSDYIKFLQEYSDVEDDADPEAEGYGLTYDCPLQKSIFTTASLISGGTIVAAEAVMNNEADVAINWFGGWHHAKRDSASGFCYINDIVLGILKLREKYERILYVDLDLHHGDGVEEAFSMTNKIMTVSFHKYVAGFFPGSGSVDHTGEGKGKFYAVNIPLLDGIKDAQFFFIFNKIMDQVKDKFQPQVIVIQCGADGLSEDPMASFNLTHIGLARCVCSLLAWNMPTVLLGGGGYNFPNTAKCWTLLTALAAGKRLPMDIPEHEHFLEYGPTYDLSTRIGNRKDCNTVEYLKQLLSKVYRNLSNI